MERGAPPGLDFASVDEYAATLGNADFWQPYVQAALQRHGLSAELFRGGTQGTFPTVLAGTYVVKLFPALLSGAECFDIERSVHQLFLDNPRILAPRLVAHGHLFDTGWPWPYVITSRLNGVSWRDATLAFADQAAVAKELGGLMRQVHELPCPVQAVWHRDAIADLRATCMERHHKWHTLPPRLVDQINSFLSPPSATRRLVHADLHSDHIFVDGGRLVGVIDWGDALFGDPYYELPALYFGTLCGQPRLLRAFLDGYQWPVPSDFAARAMTMTLLHEFNPVGGRTADLTGVTSLQELAHLLWDLDR